MRIAVLLEMLRQSAVTRLLMGLYGQVREVAAAVSDIVVINRKSGMAGLLAQDRPMWPESGRQRFRSEVVWPLASTARRIVGIIVRPRFISS